MGDLRHLGLAIGAALAAMPALAAEDHAADRVLSAMVACRQTPDPRARAVCYDAALDKLQQQVGQRQVVIVDREQIAQDRRTGFGFNSGTPKPLRERAAKAVKAVPTEELAEIDSTVAAASPAGYDTWTIRLASGAVWRTTENGIPIQPKTGAKVHIHRALMGSYMLRIAGGRAVRATRVG